MTDGILNIYKEKGMTSFKVVSVLRKILNVKKIGHTGTLDPDAEGVLPICIGRATKLVDFLMDSKKTYEAVMLLGKSTTTQDISGEIIEEISLPEILKKINADKGKEEALKTICEAFNYFIGEINQLPPMYSALKVDGVKLVDAARKGIEIERKPRKRTVFEFNDVKLSEDFTEISFEVVCSKGTYVRTLCYDIGEKLGVPSCLLSLKRTGASGLDLSSALTLDEVRMLKEEGRLEERIIPVDKFLLKYDKVTVNEKGLKKVLVGNFLYSEDFNEVINKDGIYRIYDCEGRFYALYYYSEEKDFLKPEKMFL